MERAVEQFGRLREQGVAHRVGETCGRARQGIGVFGGDRARGQGLGESGGSAEYVGPAAPPLRLGGRHGRTVDVRVGRAERLAVGSQHVDPPDDLGFDCIEEPTHAPRVAQPPLARRRVGRGDVDAVERLDRADRCGRGHAVDRREGV